MKVVVFGIVWMADEDGLGSGAAFGWAEVCVRIFVRDMEQSKQAQVLHLPNIVVIADIADVPIKAVGRDAQMEIARHQRSAGAGAAPANVALIQQDDVEAGINERPGNERASQTGTDDC